MFNLLNLHYLLKVQTCVIKSNFHNLINSITSILDAIYDSFFVDENLISFIYKMLLCLYFDAKHFLYNSFIKLLTPLNWLFEIITFVTSYGNLLTFVAFIIFVIFINHKNLHFLYNKYIKNVLIMPNTTNMVIFDFIKNYFNKKNN